MPLDVSDAMPQRSAAMPTDSTAPTAATSADENAPTPRRRGLGAASPEGNRRLTAMLGVTLNSLLCIQILSALFFALLAANFVLPPGPVYAVIRPLHFFVGFLLIPIAGLKILTTFYRFARYYTRNPAYHDAGPPHPVGRLIAPLLIAAFVMLVFSGIMMWSFANWWGIPWIPVHVWTAITFTVLLITHIVLHIREGHREAAEELAGVVPQTAADNEQAIEAWRRGVVTRRAVVATGVGAGVVLAVSASQVPSIAWSFLAQRRAGTDALDFPVMNYEGGGQRVDTSTWRLAVTGLVSNPLSLSYDDLMALPTEEHTYDINCVTGWTVNRRWRGVSLAHVLGLAGADPSFGNILVRSTSGYHWSHSHANALLAGTLLVTHVNDVQLDDQHGFPVRLLIPGTVGQSNVKWIDGIVVGAGAPEKYFAPNLTFNSALGVSGKGLPSDPSGKRR